MGLWKWGEQRALLNTVTADRRDVGKAGLELLMRRLQGSWYRCRKGACWKWRSCCLRDTQLKVGVLRWKKLTFNSPPFPYQLVLSWARYLSTLGLSFIVCEVGMMALSTEGS